MRKVNSLILSIFILLFASTALSEDFERWDPVCRHDAVYAAYTVRSSKNPLPIRFAVGKVYDKYWHFISWHTRAQAYSKETNTWEWLCLGYDAMKKSNFVYMCKTPDVNFAVKHYITLEEAIKDEWKTTVP